MLRLAAQRRADIDRRDPVRVEEPGQLVVDFGQLFVSFSFFLIAAAAVLTGLLFVFSLEQRNAEAGLLYLNRNSYDKGEFQEIFDDIRRDNRRASDLVGRFFKSQEGR